MMVPYFRDPEAHQLAVQLHAGHEGQPLCCTLTTMQLEPNGDVGTCFRMPPVGNIKTTPIREIWRNRPRWWEGGCCRSRTASTTARVKRTVRRRPPPNKPWPCRKPLLKELVGRRSTFAR